MNDRLVIFLNSPMALRTLHLLTDCKPFMKNPFLIEPIFLKLYLKN